MKKGLCDKKKCQKRQRETLDIRAIFTNLLYIQRQKSR